jgi:hypothetical protein
VPTGETVGPEDIVATIALSVVIILRITATITTFGILPAALRRS